MAIVNNVVTAHHGKVKLETSEQGTHFLAQLPQFASNGGGNSHKVEANGNAETLASALILE
jgi:nitrogen-specific signal transduction histidine kinase